MVGVGHKFFSGHTSNMKLTIDDIIKGLQGKLFPWFFQSPKTVAILRRLWCAGFMLTSKVSFSEGLSFIFKIRNRDEKVIQKVDGLIHGKLEEFFKQKGLLDRESIEILGQEFYPVNHRFGGWAELCTIYQQVVSEDQYQTRKLIKKDSVIIDVGANLGLFSLLASRAASSGKVYSFEPAQKTRDALVKNLKNNSNVEVLPWGLSDAPGKKMLYVSSEASGVSTFEDSGMVPSVQKDHPNIVKEEVELVTLDSFVEKYGLKKIDFIKMDCEGYEMNALRGGAKSIKKFKPIIAVSAYHHATDKKEIPELILSICPEYKYKLMRGWEEDFVFYV